MLMHTNISHSKMQNTYTCHIFFPHREIKTHVKKKGEQYEKEINKKGY